MASTSNSTRLLQLLAPAAFRATWVCITIAFINGTAAEFAEWNHFQNGWKNPASSAYLEILLMVPVCLIVFACLRKPGASTVTLATLLCVWLLNTLRALPAWELDESTLSGASPLDQLGTQPWLVALLLLACFGAWWLLQRLDSSSSRTTTPSRLLATLPYLLSLGMVVTMFYVSSRGATWTMTLQSASPPTWLTSLVRPILFGAVFVTAYLLSRQKSPS